MLILGLILSLNSCQSEQVHWFEDLEDKKEISSKKEKNAEIDKCLAYINRFPEDSIRNIQILKKTIINSLKSEDEELTYKLILLSLKNYPEIINDKEIEQLTFHFYQSYLKELETTNWIKGIIITKWNEKEKSSYLQFYTNQIKKELPDITAFHKSKQLLSMAKIHSLLFPKSENSPLFLWKSYEIMCLTGNSKEALNILDLILIRHKDWIQIENVKKEKRKIIKLKTKNKNLQYDWLPFEEPDKNHAPVS